MSSSNMMKLSVSAVEISILYILNKNGDELGYGAHSTSGGRTVFPNKIGCGNHHAIGYSRKPLSR